MATNKKSFLLYCDIIHTVEKLTDEKAGQLLKHILSYVNDKEPETDDILINIAFEPIKQSLKRDLLKWDEIRIKRSESGRKGGIKSGETRKQNEANEANALFAKQNEANEAVSDSVSVNVINNNNIKPTWKTNFEVYVNELREAYNLIINDKELIEQQQTYYPNVNIVKSIEKACVNYWATEAG